METIIVFLRDILSGTLYIVVSIVSFILILVCIFQLVRHAKKKKIAREEFEASHIVVINDKGEKKMVEFTPTVTKPLNTSVFSNPVSSPPSKTINSVPISSTNTNASVTGSKENMQPTKSVVMINPAEVALVSSTMNIIGATSAQREAMASQNMSKAGLGNMNNSFTNGETVSSEQSSSTANLSEDTLNNQNFTN